MKYALDTNIISLYWRQNAEVKANLPKARLGPAYDCSAVWAVGEAVLNSMSGPTPPRNVRSWALQSRFK